MSNFVKEVDDTNFTEEVLKTDKPVLVDFGAVWCPPCRLLSPVVDKIAEQYQQDLQVVKVDVDISQQAAEQYRIKGIPTLILFKNGQEEERIVGAAPHATITAMIDKHLVKMVS